MRGGRAEEGEGFLQRSRGARGSRRGLAQVSQRSRKGLAGGMRMSGSDVWLPFALVTRGHRDASQLPSFEPLAGKAVSDVMMVLQRSRRGPTGAMQRSHGFNDQLMRVKDGEGGGTEGRGGLLAEVSWSSLAELLQMSSHSFGASRRQQLGNG